MQLLDATKATTHAQIMSTLNLTSEVLSSRVCGNMDRRSHLWVELGSLGGWMGTTVQAHTGTLLVSC